MNDNHNTAFTADDLEASLARLGASELEQRLEFAPLLAGTGDTGPLDTDASVCCSCKIPPDLIIGGGAMAPAVTGDPTPGGDFWGSGPVSGGGF
ncbi:MAG: hypothetical protein IPK64_03480 [bacterium]|nr:hypothetical protein [bacterium]